MKILDIPQSGKRGVNVSQQGHNGQISRALAIPSNPRTRAQLLVRNHMASVAASWRTLTQDERDAWTAAATQVKSRSRLGQSGPLSGFQLFSKINCSLLAIGGDEVTAPPEAPSFELLPVTGLAITNTAGVVTLKLATTGTPADGSMLRGAPPVSQGRGRSPGMVFLGTLDAPVNNAIDISTAYKAKYGSPPAGSKVFVHVNQNINGWEDIPSEFSAIVPAAS